MPLKGMYKMKKLTEAEKYVIIGKGTEPPFTGEYTYLNEPGIYVCKQCDNPLYQSTAKFKSDCGWPSFDDQIEGAVQEIADKDGMRTEIVCANCGGHLGHIFKGEGFTSKNVRHCVNSISMKFIPLKEISDNNLAITKGKTSDSSKNYERAIFAGGCFWGIEYHFLNIEGVVSTMPGYTGGKTDKPTYEEVCSGKTGHVEAVEIIYDPSKISYNKLAELFFEIHDPSQKDGQGPDIGEQYMSAIFYTDDKQKVVAETLINILRNNGIDAITSILPAKDFYPAEDYHRRYYEKNGKYPYCHQRAKRF